MTDSAHPEYVLGHAASELERLIKQAAFYGDLTEHTLKLAGLREGMKVLDVGCGAGDVSFLAASLVGPKGHITGVDMNAETVAFATSRLAGTKQGNITFESGDITQLPYTGEFDAVIGRLIVLYLGDPVKGLTAFRRYAKPGGLIYFQEFCLPGTAAVPPVPLYETAIGWINETATRAKIDLWMGMKLAGVYRAAGLPSPQMLGMARVETGDDSAAYEYMAQTIRSLLPVIERTGVATKEEVGIDTFAQRLRDQATSTGSVLHLPELIAAWTRVPG